MDLDEIISELKIIGNRLHLRAARISCYIFGSVLTDPKLANDVDILIIYESLSDLRVLTEEMNKIELNYPFHFSYFTFFEEQELGFIKEQGAVKIFTL